MAKEAGGALKLLQRVRAEPGRPTTSDAFRVEKVLLVRAVLVHVHGIIIETTYTTLKRNN